MFYDFQLAAKKETAREKQLKEEEKILESVTEKTGSYMKIIFLKRPLKNQIYNDALQFSENCNIV